MYFSPVRNAQNSFVLISCALMFLLLTNKLNYLAHDEQEKNSITLPRIGTGTYSISVSVTVPISAWISFVKFTATVSVETLTPSHLYTIGHAQEKRVNTNTINST